MLVGSQALPPLLPSEYVRARAGVKEKVAWGSARPDLSSRVTEPRY